MSIQHIITTSYKTPGGTSTVRSETVEADSNVEIEASIPGEATNFELDLSVPITTMKSIVMACSKATGDTGTFTGLTVYTNSSSGSSPDDTFSLTPTNSLLWSYRDPNPNPVNVAITKLFITNTGTAAANFVLRSLQDPTP